MPAVLFLEWLYKLHLYQGIGDLCDAVNRLGRKKPGLLENRLAETNLYDFLDSFRPGLLRMAIKPRENGATLGAEKADLAIKHRRPQGAYRYLWQQTGSVGQGFRRGGAESPGGSC